MKSRCNADPIEEPSSNEHCPALFRQLPHLKRWLHDAAQSGVPAIALGDFNRRLDREAIEIKPTDMWDVITGASTATPSDDVKLAHVPANRQFLCWPRKENPNNTFAIDFFVLTEKAQQIADPVFTGNGAIKKTLKKIRRANGGRAITARSS
jgi:hypothetical protein